MTWRVPNKWKLPSGEQFYGVKLDIFEHTLQEYNYVTPHLSNYRTVIDIGAHIGSTTVRYAKDFTTVQAFEPMYVEELKQNTSHLSNVIRHNIALSDKEGETQMIRHSSNTGMTMVIEKETIEQINRRSWWSNNRPTVKTTILDSYNFNDVDFIKMDTENYVIPILKGAIETLKNNNPILQIEANKNIEEVDAFLKKLGYNLYDTFSVERFYKK